MIFREALIEDISQIQIVRNAVKENILSNPDLVTDQDCEKFLTKRGKGWVCQIGGKVVGFSIIDLQESNVWALFIDPQFEKRGIGKKLHQLMLDWYFSQTKTKIWLGTDPNTRAEVFYQMQGWKSIGMHENGEVHFEMTFDNWVEGIYSPPI